MKSITEVLGSLQLLLPLDFDLQEVFESYLTKEHKGFLSLLRVVEPFVESFPEENQSMGRPSYSVLPFLRAALAKRYFKIVATSDLRARLLSDANLRQICGFENIPSAASFSRYMSYLADNASLEESLGEMVKDYYEGQLVNNVARDSTAISAREKPVDKKKEVKPLKHHKRGRPKKGQELKKKSPTVLEEQKALPLAEARGLLPTSCAWGCKKNSQGNLTYWKGYKLHLDVTEEGIPVSAIITGANVHDSQCAIPLERMTEQRINFRSTLMDSAYDAKSISQFVRGRGRIPIIDHNPRRKDLREAFDEATKEHYKKRSVVERANSHLKDWLLPEKLLVRGIKKVSFELMCGVICLAAIKILEQFILPSLI